MIDEGKQPWQNFLVGKFLGRRISLDKVQVSLSSLWHPQYGWEIFLMSYGYFIFRFSNSADLDRVLLDGLLSMSVGSEMSSTALTH